MEVQTIGQLGLAALLLLVFMRVPVAVSMGLVGIVGYGAINGFGNAFRISGQAVFDMGTNYTLSQLPLFILMGDLAVRSGMSGRLYRASRTIFSGLKGSQAFATLGACAGFGAISGSSVATAATMTRVALPSMNEANYDNRLSTGTIAAGGTLGILIPPSLALVVFGMIAEQSIPRLYAASLIPGLILLGLYILTVVLILMVAPTWAPSENGRTTIAERLRSLLQVWEIAVLFTVVMGGLYSGLLTATEAAAVGAFGAWALGVLTRRLSWKQTWQALLSTTSTTAMLFVIMFAANIFTYFLVLTQIPQSLVAWTQELGLNGIGLLLLIGVFYVVLGCFLEAFGMILITVPIFLPVIQQAGYDPIWYGVFLAILIETGMITPPVGMNIFVMQAQLPSMPLPRLYQGVLPFIFPPIILAVCAVVYPEFIMWLPNLLFN